MNEQVIGDVAAIGETVPSPATLANQLKLVVWDLDETFWNGTLSEGSIEFLGHNVGIVKELAQRGILSSICSKNDSETVRKVLEEHGLWDYFIFPVIAFEAKGRAIATMIEQAGLRPDNVLFVDDNPINLGEAAFFSPNLMTALPQDILPVLLSLPQAKGKPDPGMERLRQYRNLETKFADRETTDLDNAAFLRSCNIRISIDLEVESQFDRVVELVNRSNQLNFTKVRLETSEAREAFRGDLNAFGAHAGLIRATDNYGDYGIVGFFLMSNVAGSKSLRHFVFSCRTMNMGIEQFVYERLGRPEVDVVEPVSNPIVAFDKVDWIEVDEAGGLSAGASVDSKLLLLGGCDLLQIANYCSANREEFVNYTENDVIVRFDDPGFILSDRDVLGRSERLPAIPAWSAQDAVRFDAALGNSRIVIVSLWDALFGQYFMTDDGVMLRMDEGDNGLGYHLAHHPDETFGRTGTFMEFSPNQKIKLIEASLDRIVALSPDAEHRFLIGRNVNGAEFGRDLRRLYNRTTRAYCERTGQFEFVDVDEVVPTSQIIDGTHYTRMGYFKIAERINAMLGPSTQLMPARTSRTVREAVLPRFVKRAYAKKSGGPVGKLPRILMRLPLKVSGGRFAI